MFEKGLAYRAKTKVNWCPSDKTVLANEQVVEEGRCERCDAQVEQREIEQWMLRTTDFAQELIDGLESLDWPESTKTAQRNWIGASKGADITFALDGAVQDSLTVFTTRPDTLFGCTFMVISPELAHTWISNGWQASDEVRDYVKKALTHRELERLEHDKTGVNTDIHAVNPVNDEKIPIWIADYVLGSYGTGAIMAVPAHDERDMAFAKAFGLPIRQVITPLEGSEDTDEAFTGEGTLVNSGPYDELASVQACERIISDLAGKNLAEARVNYKLRDWVLSRQRYWGCPIPLIKCDDCGYVPVPDDQLPVTLPPLEDFKPTDDGRSPLAKVSEWANTTCPKCGGKAEREADTMDTFVDSSWYFLRYADPKNDKAFADPNKMKSWLPVPMYVGGAEHNTMHLLYSRFWTRALESMGYVPFTEPFLGRRNHGIILGQDGQKMSKSRGNVVDPDDLVSSYGADTVRMYLAFMAPYEQGGPWDPKGINGVYRFLKRFWGLVQRHAIAGTGTASDPESARRTMHEATKEIGKDLANLRLNTAVSWAMKMLNALEDENTLSTELLAHAVTIVAPMAPHIAEELWSEVLDQDGSVHEQAWPEYDEKLLVRETIELPVQVNGKLRGTITAKHGDDEATLVQLARTDAKISRYLGSNEPKKVIYVPGRMLNLIVD
jgi:leucyl-tRNA synthetase